MSSVIRSLMIKIGADLTDFDKNMKTASKQLASTGKSLTSVGSGLTKGVTVPLVGAVAGLTGLAVKGAETADEILTLSSKTGIAAKTLQEMQYASELVDVPLETMTGSMFKLGKSMDAARGGIGTQAEAFKQLGIAVTNSDGSLRDSKQVWYEAIDALGNVKNETERNVLAQKIFGKSFADLNPLIAAGGDALKKYMDEADDMGAVISDEDLAALGKFDDTMQKLKASFAVTGAKIGAAFLPVIQALMPIIEQNILPMIKQFAEWVGKMSKAFAELSPGTQQFILTLLGIAIAAGPVLMGVGKLFTAVSEGIKTVKLLVGAFEIVKKAFGVLSAALMANPIILIIAGIALAAILIITHWKEVSGFFIALWDGIKTVFQGAWDFIKNLLTTVWNGIKDTALTIWNGIKDFFSGIWNGLKDTFSNAWEGIKSTASTIWGGISSFFGNLWSSWKQKSSETWSNIKSGASTAWQGISSTFSNFGNTIKTNFSTFISTVKSLWSGMWSNLKNGINNAVSGIKTAAQNIVNAIKNVFKNLASQALQWGKDLINGLIKGIKSMFGALGSAAKGAASKITSFLHFSCPDEGPLREYEKWMPDLMSGLAEGIKNNQYRIEAAMKSVSGGISAGMSSALNISDAGVNGAVVVSNPIYLDGKLITTATSRRQSTTNSSRSRALGVVVS